MNAVENKISAMPRSRTYAADVRFVVGSMLMIASSLPLSTALVGPAVTPRNNAHVASSISRPSFVTSLSAATLEQVGVVSPLGGDDKEELPPGVVCARGVCVLADEEIAEELCYLDEDEDGNLVGMTCVTNDAAGLEDRNVLSWDFLWPRALLLGCSMLYGTNFPLGRIMNDALPASATTSGRMLLAAAALSPFLFKLNPELRKTSVIGGCFCALGYLSQSVALLDVPAATVAFLGAVVVIITPTTNVLLGGAKLGWKDSPQTWLAAGLCMIGVGTLELGGGGGLGDIGMGDFWAVMQAVGFGVGFHFTERMMAKEPDQALSITAVQVGMTAFWGAVWALLDGTGLLGGFGGDHGAWLLDETTRAQYALPGLFLSGFGGDEALRNVAAAAVWTGLITTAANRIGETTGLGKMSSSEAAVLLATEPLWAALFASFLLHETMGPEDILGGALIICACLTTAVKPETLQNLFGIETEEKGVEDKGDELTIDIEASMLESVNSTSILDPLPL